MSVTADVLRTHLDYTAWASRRLLDAASQLPESELTHDFRTADRSVLGTLVHIFASERAWLSRLQQVPPPAFVTDADRSLKVLQEDWPRLHQQWQAWARELTNESVQVLLDYADLKGNRYTQPVWQLLLHVVNHATHHRGQVSGFLRSLGHTPPPVDLIFYYRSMLHS